MATPDPRVRSLQPTRDEETVAALKEWLARAESGEVIGVVLLGNLNGGYVSHHWAGQMPAGVALLAFEWWKARAFQDP
jgi:hypothetical protein